MKELKALSSSDPDALGITVSTIKDDLYKWEVKISGFDPMDPSESALADDLTKVQQPFLLTCSTCPGAWRVHHLARRF